MQIRNSMGPAGLMISVLALAVTLSGGTAVAASLITTKQIKNNAVTSAKVKNGTLTLKDFKASERAKLIGPRGPATASRLNTVLVESPEVTVPAYDIGTVVAYCPAGKKVTGGGYFVSIAIAAANLPATTTSWGVVINNSNNNIPIEVTAWAVCA